MTDQCACQPCACAPTCRCAAAQACNCGPPCACAPKIDAAHAASRRAT